jgi:hypothetical protein
MIFMLGMEEELNIELWEAQEYRRDVLAPKYVLLPLTSPVTSTFSSCLSELGSHTHLYFSSPCPYWGHLTAFNHWCGGLGFLGL